MPLQDRFGKRASKKPEPIQQPANRAKTLSGPPSLEDLRYSMLQAQALTRQPVMLTWRAAVFGQCYLLTVIRNSESFEPTWSLHLDDTKQLTMLWSYTTPDPELIKNLLTDKAANAAPAVIPESLRNKEQDPSSQPQFFEQYQIDDTIGKGGMGVIYKARERAGGDMVALKILKADLLIDPSNVERFKHEASVASSLAHPNLIKVREYGISRYGQPFISMDYLDGVELKTLLSEKKRLSLPEFINVFTQICEALSYAHDRGLIHRDLKPGNIMLVKNEGGQNLVKIIDFGIAKSMNEGAGVPGTTTTQGSFIGSPAYMSPEQCGGAVLDSRSDIYSLGCVMYEAISGVLPFNYDNVLKVIMAHVNEPAPPFAVVCPDVDVPAELERIILQAMEKHPDDRYQSARELCDDLWAFAAMGEDSENPRGKRPARTPAQMSRTLQNNPLSDRAYTLLWLSGILTDRLMAVVQNCAGMLDEGEITTEQAIAIIRHSLLEEGAASLPGQITSEIGAGASSAKRSDLEETQG